MARAFTTRPTLRGTYGMVSSSHWLASAAAMGVLERGGNAFDAAVCAGFVLHVVEPHLNGPGGEVPAIIATSANPGVPRVLCGQGVSPARATIAHYRDLGLDRVPGAGPLAATVPGAVDAWLLLLRDHGTWTLRDVLEPAIGYARAGHPLSPDVVRTIGAVRDLFVEHWPTSASTWLRRGDAPTADAMFANKAYADTLELTVLQTERGGGDRESQIEHARAIWREGFVAEAVTAFSQRSLRDSSGEEHPGLLTGDDLADWSASWETPATLDWNGYTVAKPGTWSQGPVLLQTLGILDALGDPIELEPISERAVHFGVEAIKLAMADREAWYGDEADVATLALLSRAYASKRAALIGALAAEEVRPGSPDGRTPVLPTAALPAWNRPSRPAPNDRNGRTGRTGGAGGTGLVGRDGSAGEPATRSITRSRGGLLDTYASGNTRGDTCHVDVVDRHGNMIAATPSGGWLQSSPTIPELGFCLGTRAQMFWLEEGLPSSLAPRRRPRTTLSPTLVSRDGQPVLACGSPGGDQQDQWQLLLLLRHLGQGIDLQEAIDAPAWHTSSFPSSFWPREMEPRSLAIEDRVGDRIVEALERRGHRVTRTGAWSQGRLCAVGRDPETGILTAGANPRGMQGYAVGR